MTPPLQSTAYQWRAVARNLAQILVGWTDDRTPPLTSQQRVDLARAYRVQCEAHGIPEEER